MGEKSKRYFPRSKLGLVLAILYLAFAVSVAHNERYHPGSGSFITMQGLATIAITYPASFLLSLCIPWLSFDQLGFFETPYSSKTLFAIGLAIALCTLLVYLFGAALGSFSKALFGKDPD